MQGALHGVTRKGIQETDGASLCLVVLQRINASELKASHHRLMQLGWILAFSQLRRRTLRSSIRSLGVATFSVARTTKQRNTKNQSLTVKSLET